MRGLRVYVARAVNFLLAVFSLAVLLLMSAFG